MLLATLQMTFKLVLLNFGQGSMEEEASRMMSAEVGEHLPLVVEESLLTLEAVELHLPLEVVGYQTTLEAVGYQTTLMGVEVSMTSLAVVGLIMTFKLA